ncbi:ferritin-like domain-containing protein [Parasphingorhabdus sp.]|uniref:ferritin-like domain-containing protein n=1 Tax=Parasphingorhabdus sp. TaxID=2709688 RepID=UPI003A954CAB
MRSDHAGPVASVPESVVAAMDAALADERNAVLNYQTVLDRFGPVRPFVNIAEAEKRHINALLALYTAYNIPVPKNDTMVDPIFETADLQTLCELGVKGEIDNVRLYDEDLLPAVAGHSNIMTVMTRLRDASAQRHKPAFERCLARFAQG